MFRRGSPKLNLILSKASKRKNSPKVSPKVRPTKDNGSTSSEKTRAAWNPAMEKTLVDLLQDHNTPEYRSQNGWTSEAWNKIVKEFHEKEKYVSFTKLQIQDKEKELKKAYKLLKEARKQSGASWNNERGMIVAEPAVWANIIKSHPNAKRFRNKSFPLFEALGELHDGHIAEGTYNFTSTRLHNPPEVIQDEKRDEETTNEDEEARTSAAVARNKEPTNEDEGSSLTRRAAAVPRNKEPKESKRQRKSSNIESIMERYVEIRAKQIESETAQSTKEKEDAQAKDFSIKSCISILNTMDVTKEEKVRAYSVFKNPDSREIFLSASDEDPKSAMMWLRNEMV
ncbi:hypothetical protein BS78_08G065000 [Paspalum vaginatum]|nr:hypothetical protein BS78_08G065000 [Paspalum vaginatum]